MDVIACLLTLAVGQRTPLAILQTSDLLQRAAAREGEPSVALELRLPAVGHVAGNHREPVVNLGHRAAVDLPI